jgi:hypothetical protein
VITFVQNFICASLTKIKRNVYIFVCDNYVDVICIDIQRPLHFTVYLVPAR